MSEAIHLIGRTHTGMMGTHGPIFTIILAVYLLDEPIILTMILGMILGTILVIRCCCFILQESK